MSEAGVGAGALERRAAVVDEVDLVPGAEGFRLTRRRREPQPEQARRLARQIQNHHALRGRIGERHRTGQHRTAVVRDAPIAGKLRDGLVAIGVQLDLRLVAQ